LQENNSVVQKLPSLLSRHIGETTDWEDCRDKWEEIADYDSIVYIFGHSDGEHIYLADSNEDKYVLDTGGFLTIFKKRNNAKSRTFFFVNGCKTGGGPSGDGFLDVTSGLGFYGFIGTEAEISNEFATQYATDFLWEIINSGKSVGEVIEDMREREEFFPLSLLYTCYGNPDFRVSKVCSG
jgi:hypothetical protein